MPTLTLCSHNKSVQMVHSVIGRVIRNGMIITKHITGYTIQLERRSAERQPTAVLFVNPQTLIDPVNRRSTVFQLFLREN